jgi:hypothetical protein
MRNALLIAQSQKVFHGDSFMEPEFLAFCASAGNRGSLCLRTADLKTLRTRLNNYCTKHEFVGTTTKITDEVLEFTYTGPIYTKKPVRTRKQFQKQQMEAVLCL